MELKQDNGASLGEEINGFIINNGVVIEYVGPTDVDSVIIPLQAQIISNNIFKKELDFPICVIVTSNVKRIEDNAFCGTELNGLKFEQHPSLEYIGNNIGYGNVGLIMVPISVIHVSENAFSGFEYKNAFFPEHCSKMNLVLCPNAKVSYNNKVCRFGLSKKLVKKRSVKGAKYESRTDEDLYKLYETCYDFSKIFIVKSVIGIILSTICFGVLGLVGGLIFGGTIYTTTILAVLGLIYGIVGYNNSQDMKEIYNKVKSVRDFDKKLADHKAELEQKKEEERARNSHNSSSGVWYKTMHNSSENISEESSSNDSSNYDIYSNNGEKVGSVENKGSGRINNVYDNNGNVIGYASDNGGEIMDVYYNDNSRGTIDKK